MKIALIVPGGVDRSGQVRVIPTLLALIRRLAAEHDLHVFATHQEPAAGSWALEGAQIHNLGLPRTARRAVAAIWMEHRRSSFHIVHSIWAGSCGALAVCMGRLLRVPSVVHVAGGELVSLPDISYGGCASWRGRLSAGLVLRGATQVTCASEPMVDLVRKWRVTARRIPLGVDLRQWPLRSPVRRRRDEPARCVHVASLNPVKDQTVLLYALRRLADRGRNFHLDVVGEDTLRGKIQALAAELGVAERIRFHGFLPQRELRPIVEAAHIAVMSSRHEAGPVAVLEAAAVGVPTVGTAVGHIAEWSPRAAIGVPCQDATALCAALESVIDDEDLRMRLADEALRCVESHDADQTASAFNETYRQLAGGRPHDLERGLARASRADR